MASPTPAQPIPAHSSTHPPISASVLSSFLWQNMDKKSDFPYLHGFSLDEQERLRSQARFAEHSIYQRIDFSEVERLLEVGCGVGAQSEILLRRFPNIKKLIGIDLNSRQLTTCKNYLAQIPYAKNRYEIKKMDASQMEFPARSFDGAFLCWVLEHVKDPTQVLSEVRRVVAPGGCVVVNEVMNSSFFLEPYSPNVWQFWMAFNDYQLEIGGDPFIGMKLGNLLLSLGFRDIETDIVTWHYDNRWPAKRKEHIEEWTALLLSAADQLIEVKYVTKDIVEGAKKEFSAVSNDPNSVFHFSFMQAKAKIY